MSKAYRFDTYKYMDILSKEIIYFLTLAETLNISRASEILRIQQSGLSRALQRLEADLGFKLFHRKNSGLVLTDVGLHFCSAVKSTRSYWEDNYKKFIHGSSEPSGLVKIGFHPSFGQKYFPALVTSLASAFPQVEIEAHTLSSQIVTHKVNNQDLDFGLVITNIKHSDLVQKNIGQDYVAAFRNIQNTDLTVDKILINPEMQVPTAVVKKYMNVKKVFIKDYEIMAQTCLNSRFVALLPQSVAEKFSNLKQVSGIYLKADISFITHKEKMSLVSHKKIYDVILETCKSIGK